MNIISNLSRRTTAFLAAILLLAGLSIPVAVPQQTHAAQLVSRSLTISSSAVGTIGTSATAGQGGNGAYAKHTVKFTLATTAPTIGSIIIMYCTSPIFQATCTTPAGMTAQNITSATISGLTGTYNLDTTTANATINSNMPAGTGVCNGASAVRINCVAVNAASATAQTGTPTVTIAYGGTSSSYVTNPNNTGCSGNDNCQFFARVMVFSDTAYTTEVDYGGLAASTAQQVDITAKVQEELNFSVGTTYVAPGTTCAAFNDNGALALGDVNGVLSTATAYTALSYFRANSNTLHGTVIQYSGDTLKSGANSITAVGLSANGTASSVGTNQFGLALQQNNTDFSFTNLAASTSPYNYGNGNTTLASALFQYDTGSVTSPDTIATSTGGISCDTGVVEYLGNVSTSTPAGIYTTTITYIATGTY